MEGLPKIGFCPRCHRKQVSPFAKMNIKAAPGSRLVSKCGCGSEVVWKEREKVPPEPTVPVLAPSALPSVEMAEVK